MSNKNNDTTTTRVNTIENIRYMIGLINNGAPNRLLISVVKAVIEKVFNVIFFVYFLQYLFNSIENGSTFKVVMTFFTILIIFQIIIHFFNAFYDYYVLKSRPRLYRYIYERVIEKAASVSLCEFESPSYYDKYSRALEEAEVAAEDLIRNISELTANLARVISLIIILVRFDPILMVFSILPLINSIFISQIQSTTILNKNNEMTKYRRKINYCKKVFYEKKYANELRLFPIKNYLLDVHRKAYDSVGDTIKKYNKKLILLDIYDSIVLRTIMFVLSSIYVTYEILVLHKFSIGAYAAIMAAIFDVTDGIASFLNGSIELFSRGKSIENLKLFLQIKEEDLGDQQSTSDRIEPFNTLELKNLYYQYLGSDKYVIKDLNLTIRKGEKIAFVGYNGAGKTTLVKLIMGLYDNYAGEIVYNSKNINSIEKSKYRKKFATIFQDFQIYALPISTNIIMKEASGQDDERVVLEALKNVGLDNKVRQFPKGIDTTLTHEFDNAGKMLSGGELQKIAIARVFANKDADIVILDEPSSALDPISEFNIYQNIMEAVEDRTVIFISHRLSTTRIADRIYMFEDGKVIEEGSHEELMKNNQKYAELYQVQAQNYTDTVLEG
ncbi:ABC transporter ATP-binding protein [Clostridium sp. C8-1-8]|uniref:ABC transporter ATP-binding protein n=1 Tax=Clostridium sp. C8-1-8 TaxID=2698831 RepID=UPI00136C37DB|nr:ABC transporter ATP-binding protein [Clostridium sp. C8-1-8]